MHRHKFYLSWILFLTTSSVAAAWAPRERLVDLGDANVMVAVVSPVAVSAPVQTAGQAPITFTIQESRNIRDERMRISGRAAVGARVSIDPAFLLQHLRSESPTPQQLKDMLYNPMSVAKRFGPKKYFDPDAQRELYEYFFPVRVENPDGTVVMGQMALASVFRSGDGKMDSPAGPAKVVAETEDREVMAPIESRSSSVVEVPVPKICEECQASRPRGPLAALADGLGPVIENQSESLWRDYTDFAREFSTKYARGIPTHPHRHKKLFLKELVERFGAETAGRIVQAVTAFGEAPHRDHEAAQLAELAAIIKVIENRATSGSRHNSRALLDIGLNGADKRLSAALADWQFSVWNESDNSLPRMLAFNPDTVDPLTRRRMYLAFAAQTKMATGQVEFVGAMGRNDMYHYHANYVWPRWSRSGNRVGQALVRVHDVRADGIREVVEVDLNRQRGARHIFYAGLR